MKKFVVAIDDKGTVLNFGADESDLESDITRYDVYRACKEITMVIEQDMLVDNVMRSMIALLTPPDPEAEAKARMAETLKNREAN